MTKTSKHNRKKRSAGTEIILFLNWIAVILLLLAYSSRFIAPETFWPIAFAGLAYPVFLVINIFFLLFWTVYLKPYFLISLVTILLGYSYLLSFLSFGTHKGNPDSIPGSIKVISYNVRLFNLYGWKGSSHREMRQAIFDLIRTESPDILCIQEYYSGKGLKADYSDTISKAISAEYHNVAFIQYGGKELPVGQATYSKYPIISSEKVGFSNSDVNFCLVNDIVVDRDTLRVINTHLESVKLGKEDFSLVTEWNSLNDSTRKYQKGSRVILRKIKNAFVRRSSQLPVIEKIITESPYPVVFCGDLNDTPASYTYNKLTDHLNDAFVEAGSGIGQTYSEVIPWLRIDYILTSKSLNVNGFDVIRKSYSDHYPIVARIKVK
jgi:endonuclease/exonuclease/phosphatase family metal-dependent hydrolase